MKRNMKKTASALLVFVFVFSIFSGPTFADIENLASEAENVEIAVESVAGTTADSIDTLFREPSMPDKSPSEIAAASLSTVELLIQNDRLEFSAFLAYGNKTIELVSSGQIYVNHKTENSGIFDNLILVEMDDTDEMHFVQVRIDKNKSDMLIVLQDLNTNQLMQFNTSIDAELLENVFEVASKRTRQESDADLESKIIELYLISNNIIGFEKPAVEVRGSLPISSASPSSSSESTVSENVDARIQAQAPRSFSGWRNLLADLSAQQQTVYLSNYGSSINPSFFQGAGWQFESSWDVVPYSVAVYSSENGIGQYVTQISMLDIYSQDFLVESDVGSDVYLASLEAEYYDGMMLNYDSYTDEVSVLYFNAGPKVQDLELAVGGLSGDAFFIRRTIDGTLIVRNSLFKVALGFTSIVDILESLSEFGIQQLGYEMHKVKTFDEEYAQQIARYGSLIKTIAVNSETNSLEFPGNNLKIEGLLKLFDYTTWWYQYDYWVYPN